MENSTTFLLRHQMFPDFYPCHSGDRTCLPLAHFGPAAHPHYLIYIILNGKGVFQADAKRATLHAGEGFLIRPNQQVFYQADADHPWRYIWVAFSGARCPDLLAAIGLGDGRQVFHTPDGALLTAIVRQMLSCNTAGTQHDFMRTGHLLHFFACLAQSLSQPLSALSRDEREQLYVQRAAAFVQDNYANFITVSDMAHYVSLNRSYLFTLFQRVLQVSPHEFLTDFRLSRAKEQLTLTRATVGAIAQSVGYRDPLVFSKAFKRMVGLTPAQYRKQEQAAR